MRRRLAVAFMVVTLASVLGAGVVRTLTLTNQLEEQELAHLHREAQVALAQITLARAEGRKVTSELLAGLVTEQSRLQYDTPGGRSVEASGSSYAISTAESGALSATVFGDAGTVVANQSRQPLEAAYRRDLPSVLTLLAAITMLAGVAGSFAARLLAAPFRRLASAAHALSRGRFDLDLPHSRLDEAESIATALRAAASRLEVQRRQEHALAERASHVLRTPLTRMSLTLDEIAARNDLPDGVREAVQACQGQAALIGAEVQDLVEITRTSMPTAELGLPLRTVAEEIVARWSDRLPARRRVSGSVEGDLELPCAPGPLEQVLDLLLDEVSAHGRGPVRLDFTGRAEHVLVMLAPGALGDLEPESYDGVVAAGELVTGLGGRMACRGAEAPLEIRLPTR